MAWRSVIRKPVKSILLFFVVFMISLFFLSGMASRNASIATQNKTKQAVGAGFLIEANEANKRNRADEILAKKTEGEEGNFDGVNVEKIETNYGTSWRVSYDNSFQTILIHDMEKIAAVSGISEYNITTAVTAVNPVDFSRIEDDDVDQSSDLLCVSLIGNKDMALDANVLSGNVTMKDGRMITEEDIDVCVISEELAAKNNLSVRNRIQFNDRTAAPAASDITADYLVRQQVQKATEQNVLEEGKVAKNAEDSEETVTGVSVAVTPELILYDWIGVALSVVISVGAAGILIARKNPKDIFSEIS